VESEFFVESLGFKLGGFIKINNLPLLVLSSIVTPNTNLLTFLVFASSNIEDLAGLPVDELAVLILEDLEPS